MDGRTPSLLPLAAGFAAIFFFSAMDAVMKDLAIALGALSAVIARGVAGVMLSGGLFLARKAKWPERAEWRWHALRGIVLAFTAVAFFHGIARVPLADGVALSFVAPLIAIALAAVFLGERIRGQAVSGALLGLGGVMVIGWGKLRGQYNAEELEGMIAVLLGAIAYAGSMVLMRRQAQRDSAITMAFVNNMIVLALLAPLGLIWGTMPSVAQVPAIGLSALLAVVSALLLTWAYARAQAQVVASVEYTAFVWAALFGWLFFQEAVTAATLAGCFLIIAGCWLAARQPRDLENSAGEARS
jgi:S-adenosylmethionine uptake transporter